MYVWIDVYAYLVIQAMCALRDKCLSVGKNVTVFYKIIIIILSLDIYVYIYLYEV